MSDNYTIKMIIIDDISFRYVDIFTCLYDLPSNDITQRITFYSYNKSIIDIWNINANINIRTFDDIFFKIKCLFKSKGCRWHFMLAIQSIYTPEKNCCELPNIII